MEWVGLGWGGGVVWCGGGGVGVVVASVCHSSGQTHRTSIPTVVASLTTHDNMYAHIYVHVHVHEHVHGKNCNIDILICACACKRIYI